MAEKNVVVDIGNTRIKYAEFTSFDNLICLKIFKRSQSLLSYLEKEKPSRILVASVRHTPDELKILLPNAIILSTGTKLPIVNEYQSPATLGYDRLAAAVGAAALFPGQNCLILDLGTAAKYDFISSKNAFLGGIIAPGMQMRFKALKYFTKKLPLVSKEGSSPLVGQNTSECIRSGVVNGMTAEINGIIEAYIEQFKSIQIILTGGDATFFESTIKYPTFAASNLVLLGLNRILDHNAQKI